MNDQPPFDPADFLLEFASALPDWDPLEPPCPMPPAAREWIVSQVSNRAEKLRGHEMAFDIEDIGRAHRKGYAMGIIPSYSGALNQFLMGYLHSMGMNESQFAELFQAVPRPPRS